MLTARLLLPPQLPVPDRHLCISLADSICTPVLLVVYSNALTELLLIAQICFELLAGVHAHEHSQSRHIQVKHRLPQPANLQK